MGDVNTIQSRRTQCACSGYRYAIRAGNLPCSGIEANTADGTAGRCDITRRVNRRRSANRASVDNSATLGIPFCRMRCPGCEQ